MKKYNKHIIIAGSARSGTSWLSEVISKTFRYRLLFEPDHENHVPKAKELLTDKFIETEINKPLHRFLTKIFNNRLDNNWIAQNSNRKYKIHLLPLLPKKYIIKLIRSNLAIKHINEDYNIPVVFIIRNPYEVIFSQNRVKFPWLYNLSYFQEQPDLVNLIKDKTGFDICKNNFTKIEILAIRWCIENVVPLQYQSEFKNKAAIVRYEDLKGNLEAFQQLAVDFNIELHPNIEKIYIKPSSKTHPKSEIVNGVDAAKKLSEKEYQQVKNILTSFKVTLYEV